MFDIKNYDLFYLCKWNDEIQKHRTISKEKNPENIRTKVLNNGNSKTGITNNPTGGKVAPISIDGQSAA